MPLNGAGVFSPPAGTTATSNTTILSAAYNALVADLTSTLNTAAKFQDASVTAPNGFAADSNTGFYRIGADNLGIALGGVKHADFATTGVALLEKAAPTSSGTNTVTLTWPIVASALASEQRIVFKAGGSNTSTAVTLNLNGLGAKAVKKFDGGAESVLLPRDIEAGQIYLAVYDSTLASGSGAWVLVNPSQQGRYPPGTLYGLTLSNNASANKIDVALGACRDGADSANIDLAAALTAKDLATNWAVGSSAGLLDTGSIGNNWYAIWAIKRPDTGVVDVLASLSFTAPTMPTNYTLKRYIGAIQRSGGSIKQFFQRGDRFTWTTPGLHDFNVNNPGTATTSKTISVPPTAVTAIVVVTFVDATPASTTIGSVRSPSSSDPSLSGNGPYDAYIPTAGAGVQASDAKIYEIETSTGAIQVKQDTSTADHYTTGSALGWIDTRGRT